MVPGIEIKEKAQIVGTLLGSLESQLGSIQEKALAADQVYLQNINRGIFLVAFPGRPKRLHWEMNWEAIGFIEANS